MSAAPPSPAPAGSGARRRFIGLLVGLLVGPVIAAAGALLATPANAQSPAAPPAATPGLAPAVVVWDFDNQTPAGASALAPQQLEYLRRALAESVTQALLEGVGLPVVERQRLRDLLAEHKLSASELADADSRLRLGRIVGAGRMVFGGFFALGDEVQVNVRVVDTATSRVLFSDEFNSAADGVMQRAEPLSRRLAHALGGGAAPGRGYAAPLWQAYDRALALSDAGQYEQAIAALQRLLAQDKNFTPAERQLVALLDKMRRR